MEILQTIWTALTTENELLTNIIILPVGFVESIVNYLIFSTLLNINCNKKQVIKYVVCISTALYLTGIFIPNPYKAIVNFVLIVTSIHFLLDVPVIKSIIAMIIPVFLAILCESFIIKMCMFYLKFDINTITLIPLYRFMLTLLIQLLVFIIYLFVKYLKIHIVILENLSNKNKVIFLSNLIFAIMTLSIQFLITGFYLNKLPGLIVLCSNISLIAYFVISIYSLTKTTQLEIANLNLEQEKEHNRLLKIAQDDMRGFRHDFSNIMCTIGGYVQVKDMEGLSKYYSQIQKDIAKVNNIGALDPAVINNPAVFTLIASKYDKATEENITMNINCFLDLNELNMKIYEFTRVLGILLDNAIEAAKECDKKIIHLEIRKDTNRHRQLLIIENTYKEKDIDTDKIYEKNYSTKPGNTGLGLWEVRQILKRNNNLNLYTTANDEYFRQQLEMYNQ